MNGEAVLQLWSTIGCVIIALAALGAIFRAVRDTTLMAVWCWGLVSVVVVGAVEIAGAANPAWIATGLGEVIRYAAAAVAFCPVVALLGAKRPQDRAWQLIVFSFWIVLALPAWQTLLLRPDRALTVHPIWSWFLVVLVIVGVTNYLPTRFALPALLAGAGQLLLVWRELRWSAVQSGPKVDDWLPIAGLALIALAAAIAAIRSRWRPKAPRDPLAELWSDFCDSFGVVWGLRVAERVNATAAQNNSKLRLTWHGVESATGKSVEPTSDADLQGLKTSLLPLLGRFVSRAWIDRRRGR